MDFPRFSNPWALTLLLLIPWSLWLGMGIQTLSRLRKATALTLRTVILALLVLALAGTEWVKVEDELAVFFLMDHSDSVDEGTRLQSTQWVRNTAELFMTDRDKAGVIVFGEDASIELNAEPMLGLRDISSYVGGAQTDLASAIRLALAAFPQGHMRRMVIYSDGNETKGTALEEVKLAQSAGVDVQIVPLHVASVNEVRVKDVATPSQVNADEPFQLRIVVSAQEDTRGTLRVFQRVGDQRRMMPPQDVDLRKGDNTFVVSQELSTSGFYEYEVQIDAEEDTIIANNSGQAFTIIQGEPRVLYVSNDAEDGEYVLKAFAQEGIAYSTVRPQSFPTTLAQIQNYDVVVLSNVSATQLTSEQMQLIEAMVRDMGIGLVMIGGPDSFGAGGYLDTPVERALPVNMNIKQRKVLPKGALALILHTCEFPEGNAWAREIGLASLNVLSSQDLMGVLAYHYQGGDRWMQELGPVGDKSAIANAITVGSQNIGDMPSVQPTLQLAYESLSTVDAAAKRVLMISDGDPGAPSGALVKQLVKAGISVSTVVINPHSGSDESMMRNLAEATGGQYYFVNNPNNLPQIFTKEASVVKRGLLIEQPFVPEFNHDSELLIGLAQNPFPELLGYVVTSPKDSATLPLVTHEGDPLFAHWRYGLGKSVAFTSDVTSRWAVNWLGWEGFDRFWVQTVRWATRELAPTDFQVRTWVENNQGRVRIDAVDGSGNFINFLEPEGVVTGPGPEYAQTKLTLQQTEPGVYEDHFPLTASGVYMMNLQYTQADGTKGSIPTGLALSYSPEYNVSTTNVPLLQTLSGVSGSGLRDNTYNPFMHDMVATPYIKPLWPSLLLIAICLFPFEIFVRRVLVPWGLMIDGLSRLVRRAPKRRVQLATGSISTGAIPRDYRDQEVLPESAVTLGGSSTGNAPEATASDEAKPVTPEPAKSDYTQKLLEAKEKARERKQKRIDRLDDK